MKKQTFTVSIGTLSGVLKQAQVSPNEFIEHL